MESDDFALELKKFGARLKELRKHRKLKLLDLEVLSGVNDSDISRYERGKENIEFHTIYKLAKGLEVEIRDITDYSGPLPESSTFKGLGKVHAAFNNKKKKKKK